MPVYMLTAEGPTAEFMKGPAAELMIMITASCWLTLAWELCVFCCFWCLFTYVHVHMADCAVTRSFTAATTAAATHSAQ